MWHNLDDFVRFRIVEHVRHYSTRCYILLVKSCELWYSFCDL